MDDGRGLAPREPVLLAGAGSERQSMLISRLVISMVYSSEDDSDISDSEIGVFADKCYLELKEGKHKVQMSDESYTCPFCTGKKKHAFPLKDLLQHAFGIGSLNQKADVNARHLALAKYLKSDLLEIASPSLQLTVIEDPPKPKKKKNNFIGRGSVFLPTIIPYRAITGIS